MLNREQGFTLVEALVAVLIFSIAMVPLFYIIDQSFSLISETKDKLIANNLVQEGLEVVRSIRDASWHQGDPEFNTDLPNGSYRVQWDSTSVLPLGTNPSLKLDGSGLYNYSTGTDTKYSRSITITEIVAGVEIMVVSEVSWLNKGGTTMVDCPLGTSCVRAEVHLYDWK
jgi:prepilin-type N-terminal cleavage/methylation domain-containing protein